MNDLVNSQYIVNSILFSVIGIVILVITFWVIEKLTPQNLVKEILEKQNTAVAIIAAATILAIAHIVAAAIHG